MIGEKLAKFMATYNKYLDDYSDESREFFRNFDLELAKAFMSDFPESSISVSKIILAVHNIGEIKVKIE